MNYQNLNNPDYWAKRAEDKASAFWEKEEKVEEKLRQAYLSALEDIKKEYSSVLSKYGDGNLVDYTTMNKNLTASELKLHKVKVADLIAKYKDLSDESILLEIEKLGKYRKLSRLQAQMHNIELILIELGIKEEELIGTHLEDTFEESYYQTIYQIQHGTSIGLSFTLLNSRAIEEAIKYQWAGAMFSENIWASKDTLLKNLKKTITDGIIRGESYWKMTSNLHKTMDSSGYSNCLRIIRTETAHIIEEASAKGYQESGIVDQYTIIATLDSKTSKTCQSLDGKVFNLKDKQVGTNYPPLHPNCRTTVAPYFKETTVEQRIAREEDGKNYYVDGSMTYKEWSEKYLKK
ncbi:minor capsid protein [Enterococcus casseliflavus]|uniref:minor capsid protein n=1 Tax=Enterococcus casseliflavus TaxID=37734 RepID=UPI002DB77F42|nr:minor capsid protein [Enterococcus casseliflavus]MEB6213519.1 minor capsid protein [Enterococcus casseliflavus]